MQLVVGALAGTALRVAHLVMRGAIGAGQQHEPDVVADRLWGLHAEAGETFTVMA